MGTKRVGGWKAKQTYEHWQQVETSAQSLQEIPFIFDVLEHEDRDYNVGVFSKVSVQNFQVGCLITLRTQTIIRTSNVFLYMVHDPESCARNDSPNPAAHGTCVMKNLTETGDISMFHYKCPGCSDPGWTKTTSPDG